MLSQFAHQSVYHALELWCLVEEWSDHQLAVCNRITDEMRLTILFLRATSFVA
ncbi:hypothetical protein AG1IA_00944 [Rhizoctonia solani AG-1 IA]|uniref:Uncharacterized protein n=1 Tax=Thanatephorus cucumeris (strain AG1-IA) TaxID=983506 RepID=L8X7H6_THACA|nr:hypothetical protein AG1IA_00944 [Rhizoctonia solani AG-1 IA]